MVSFISRHMEGAPTTIDLLYPFLNLLQAECSFGPSIVFVRVDMEDVLAGAGEGSSKTAASVRDDFSRFRIGISNSQG